MDGFTMIPNDVLRDRGLTLATRVVYGVILSYAYGQNPCTASTERLCADAGIGRTALFEAVAELRERGLIEVTKRRSGTVRRNVYVPVRQPVGHDLRDDETLAEDAPDTPESNVRNPDAVRKAVSALADEAKSAQADALETKKKKREEDPPNPPASGGAPSQTRPLRANGTAPRQIAAVQNAPRIVPIAAGPKVRAFYRELKARTTEDERDRHFDDLAFLGVYEGTTTAVFSGGISYDPERVRSVMELAAQAADITMRIATVRELEAWRDERHREIERSASVAGQPS